MYIKGISENESENKAIFIIIIIIVIIIIIIIIIYLTTLIAAYVIWRRKVITEIMDCENVDGKVTTMNYMKHLTNQTLLITSIGMGRALGAYE
jgi:hypothetical protein